METVVNVSHLNVFRNENWPSDLCGIDQCIKVNKDFNCHSPRAHNHRLIEKDCCENTGNSNEVIGDCVLLWLPPLHRSGDAPCDEALKLYKKDGGTVKTHVFINICSPIKDGDLRLATKTDSYQVDEKTVVGLLTSGDTPSGEFHQEPVTVVDLLIEENIFSKLKTNHDVSSFSVDLIDYFINNSSLLPVENNDVKYNVIYNATPKIAVSDQTCEEQLLLTGDGVYRCESPKKTSKSRKAGKKNKRDTVICGKEKKSRFMSETTLTAQTKVLGFNTFIASSLKSTLKTSNPDLMPESTELQIDFSGVLSIPANMKIVIEANNGLIRWKLPIFYIGLRFLLPDGKYFSTCTNVPYDLVDNKLKMSIEHVNIHGYPRKTMHSCSSSTDSGIGCEDSTLDHNDSNASPTFSIEQTTGHIKVTVSCGPGLETDSVQVYQVSALLMMIVYVSNGNSTYYLKIASADIDKDLLEFSSSSLDNSDDTHDDNTFKICSVLADSRQNNYDLKRKLPDCVSYSADQLVIVFDKENTGDWSCVWAGIDQLSLVQLETSALSEHQVPLSLASVSEEDDPVTPLTDEEGGSADGLKQDDEETVSAETVATSPSKNVNKKKNFRDVIENSEKSKSNSIKNDKLRTKVSSTLCHNENEIYSENTKKKSKAVKLSLSSVDDKENSVVRDTDEVFTESDTHAVLKPNWSKTEGKPHGIGLNWSKAEGKRQRRSSETTESQGGHKAHRERGSPPLAGVGRPRGILKCRGRSYSESHIGSIEECLGEELLDKYDSAEQAVVNEFGCLEGLLEECGWVEEEDEDTSSGSPTKKNVTFNDVEKTHLFMSKTSIVNQMANDNKKAMRMKMKEQKKKIRVEKRHAQKSGSSYEGGSNSNSSYRSNNGYNSFDDDVTTEESDGAELCNTSSCTDTTDNNTTEDDASDCGEHQTLSSPAADCTEPPLDNRSKNNRKHNKKNKKKRGVELSNNLIFQLDLET